MHLKFIVNMPEQISEEGKDILRKLFALSETETSS
jgi:hypothetical protein